MTGHRSSTQHWLFILGLAIPLLTGGNFFLFLTPTMGMLCFDLVAIAAFATFARQPASNEPGVDPIARLALISALVLALWWGAILVIRPSGPRAPLEAQGIFSGILLFAALSRFSLQTTAVWSFARGLVIATLVTAAFGQYQYWIAFPRDAPILAATGIGSLELINANFYNANCYGAFLSAVILLGVGVAVVDRGTPRGWSAAFASILLVATLLLSA